MKTKLSIWGLLMFPIILLASLSPQELFPTVLSSSIEIKLHQTIALKQEKSGEYIYDKKALGKIDLEFSADIAKDTTPPIITLNGDTNITIMVTTHLSKTGTKASFLKTFFNSSITFRPFFLTVEI